MSGEHPDYRPHRRYTVTLRTLGGVSKSVRVVTNRGEVKAAYLAAIATTGLLRRPEALDVEVRDDGPAEVDAQGSPVLRGYAFDRDEW